MFKNREQAGKQLAAKLMYELDKIGLKAKNNILVVGLPRGGVPVAKEIALILKSPLTILASKKIGAPDHPEFAIGAVSSAGVVVFNDEIAPYIWQKRQYVDSRIKELTNNTRQMEESLLTQAGLHMLNSYANKIVIVVDDGIATGMTTEAALKSARKMGASCIILATPVIAASTKRKLEKECDLLVALIVPDNFMSVGQFYEDFHQMGSIEVVNVLQEAAIDTRTYTSHS